MKKAVLLTFIYCVIGLIIFFKNDRPQKLTPLINESLAFTPIYPVPSKIDPNLQYNWALKDDSAIQIKKAWEVTQGNKNVVVAVIDTGVDYHHPDLKENLWKNLKEIPNNGIDDDHNGFIDDIMGWDFVNNDSLPYDDHGHGTHVAGIIGAQKGNGIGISGVCPNVSLMILKYYSPKSSGQKNLQNTIQAFQYAIKNGAHIINYSGGGSEFSKEEFKAIREAEAKGILVVAAAGNEKQDTAVQPYYPASYDLSNIISVAALTSSKRLVDSSNYGKNKIDIAAPGYQIYSTLPNGRYGYMTGTSQATAFVTGVAALTLSKYGKIPAKKLKLLITQNASLQKTLQGKIRSSGSINAYNVLIKSSLAGQ